MAEEKLFPERRRCKACSRKLGGPIGPSGNANPVFLGLYCSTACAGMEPVALYPEDASRQCRTERDDGWVFKQRYRSTQEIPYRIREDPSTSHYWCTGTNGECGRLHIGHARLHEAEALRMLGSPDDLADVLVKMRGAATHRQVAVVATELAGRKVQPIRLKELEEPRRGQRVCVQTLFDVLAVYRSRPGVSIDPQFQGVVPATGPTT